MIVNNFFEIKGTIRSPYIEGGREINYDMEYPNVEEKFISFLAKLLVVAEVKASNGQTNIEAFVLGYKLPDLNGDQIFDLELISRLVAKAKNMDKNNVPKGTPIEI